MDSPTLETLGEFRLLREIVLPTLQCAALGVELGDDVGFVPLRNANGHLVITCDVGPKPLIFELGEESWWSWGWYCVLSNVSDLASAGAEPLAFTSSVEAPNSMEISFFKEFFEGMADACQEFRISNAGGNIRTAPRFACHGTAIGWVKEGNLVSRKGCRPGDIMVAIGECGRFPALYLKAKSKGFSSLSEADRNHLVRPTPQLQAMKKLREAGFVRAASDNSDGLLGSFLNIAERSNCAIDLDLDDMFIPQYIKDVAKEAGVNPWNIVFMWGDWQVIAAIPAELRDDFEIFTAQEGIVYSVFGKASAGRPSVYGSEGDKRRVMNVFRNENFTSGSYNTSVRSHLDYMLHAPIFLEK